MPKSHWYSLSNDEGAAAVLEPLAAVPRLADLPLGQIGPDEHNERVATDYGTEALAELMVSMRAVGLQERIKVWEVDSDLYLISSGHRRYYAAHHLGWPTIAAVVEAPPPDAATSAIARLTSNLHRKDIDPISFARGLEAILELDPALTQSELGRRFGRSQPAIANALRLLALPEEVLNLIAAGKLTPGHGLELLRITEPELGYDGKPSGKTAGDVQTELARDAVERGFSVADLRKQIGYHHQSQTYARKEAERLAQAARSAAEARAAGRDPAADERARWQAEAAANEAKRLAADAARQARQVTARATIRVALAEDGGGLVALQFAALSLLDQTRAGDRDTRWAAVLAATAPAAVVTLIVDLAADLPALSWEGDKIADYRASSDWLAERLDLKARIAAAHVARVPPDMLAPVVPCPGCGKQLTVGPSGIYFCNGTIGGCGCFWDANLAPVVSATGLALLKASAATP